MIKRLKTLPVYVLMAVICAVVIFPVFLAVILPLQASDELAKTLGPLMNFNGKYSEIDYIAQFPTLENFKELLIYSPDFYKVFWNSLFITGTILLFQTLTAVPAAWAFARFRFKWKKLLFDIYVIFMLIPFQVTMLSQYLVIDGMKLMNTRLAVILPAIFSTFPVFLIYRGFADIPRDVADSAKIDGANEWQVLRYIGLPLGRSGILACIVLSFLDLWNMVEQPLTFLKNKRLFPLSLYLPMLSADKGEMMLAAAIVTLIPAAFVFIIGQEELEQGIIASALKE
ncbi:carbohydrate ABC transporter permease [Ruminococcus flavefaciens]|uniref:carbohydrate ABC transporter permease n=1 Tax=Ruminococcus flavefaciens TaxID=1265 RepID=UPI0026EF3424|nr:carbohydrate ABC transporter permease [Ruminococcus flavefaciens]MDD7515511.1 carbohydrate ABC transporter permease [Ruminococcus flavefaciens]MDY5690204.1 carbohydrate ABC transporter permease [Ruminococcus flavefaciens]